jgi:hypothetical protein
MKAKQSLSPKTLGSDSRIGRARKLADASLPLVADLYLTHLQICQTNRNDETKRRRRRKKSAEW